MSIYVFEKLYNYDSRKKIFLGCKDFKPLWNLREPNLKYIVIFFYQQIST